jgi:hypothetical protein
MPYSQSVNRVVLYTDSMAAVSFDVVRTAYDKADNLKSECHCPERPLSRDSDMSLLDVTVLRESAHSHTDKGRRIFNRQPLTVAMWHYP